MVGGIGVSGLRVGTWVEVLNPAEIGAEAVVVAKIGVSPVIWLGFGVVSGSPLPPPERMTGKLQPSSENNKIYAAITKWLRLA